jgi:hypothetical protein
VFVNPTGRSRGGFTSLLRDRLLNQKGERIRVRTTRRRRRLDVAYALNAATADKGRAPGSRSAPSGRGDPEKGLKAADARAKLSMCGGQWVRPRAYCLLEFCIDLTTNCGRIEKSA